MTEKRGIHAFAVFVLLLVAANFLLPVDRVELKSDIPSEGVISRKSYVATHTFDVPKSQSQLESEQRRAREKVLHVFEYNSDKTRSILENFSTLQNDLAHYAALQTVISRRIFSGREDSIQLAADIYQRLSKRISQNAISKLSQKREAMQELARTFRGMMDRGISDTYLALSNRQISLYKDLYQLSSVNAIVTNHSDLTLIKDNKEVRIETSRLLTREKSVDEQFEKLQLKYPDDQALQSAFYEVLFASTSPNVFYLESETRSRRLQEAGQVLPMKRKVIKGMEILSAGDIVTPEAVEDLLAQQLVLDVEENRLLYWFPILGRWGFVGLLLIGLGTFFVLSGQRQVRSPLAIWAIAGILLVQFVAILSSHELSGFLFSLGPEDLPEYLDPVYIHPAVLSAILGTILFDVQTGMALSLFTGAYIGMVAGYDLNMAIAVIAVNLSTSMALRNIRYRSQFLVALMVGIVMLALVLGIDTLLRAHMGWSSLLANLSIGSLSLLLSHAISSILLIHIFEKLFRLTTNLTLIELSDFNHPALKLISGQAPSTFHHSIMVGNLAEKAAERIGANPLLARVSALYHDIGKTINPAYFAENQRGSNLHDEMTPEESALIIRGHVKDALELARQYNIPPVVRAGIPEHHGTSLIRFFYHKARQEGRMVDKEKFRYPGPKPRSRETAILMMADAIEAGTRSLDDPTPDELLHMVREVIQTRLQEGQFDECDLMLPELKQMERGFLSALEGMFHKRLPYPEESRKPMD